MDESDLDANQIRRLSLVSRVSVSEESPSRDDFVRQVRNALAHFDNLAYLQTHPLTRYIRPDSGSRRTVLGLSLRQALLDSIESLQSGDKGSAVSSRHYRLLQLRYFEGLDSREVQSKLAIGRSQFFREHQTALEAVVSILGDLWDLNQGAPEEAPVPSHIDQVVSRSEPRHSLPQLATQFVGRVSELDHLRARFSFASERRGNLVVLVGEAGVGKTELARRFATQARDQGALVAWGSCFEGDWQTSYNPWVETVRELMEQAYRNGLRLKLGSRVAALGQLVPALASQQTNVEADRPLSPDQERLRLFDAVYHLLAVASEQRPVLLVLDDLHWADRDSQYLLHYLARLVGRMRLLILGTYRHPDLARSPETSSAGLLAELRREPIFEQITLQGLHFPEVVAYLSSVSEESVPQALARTVYSATDGNPFYVHEVLQHLVEEGKIQQREGRWSTDLSIRELGIPEGVRQVVSRRVSRLSAETISLLTLASGLAGGFSFAALQVLTDFPEETLLDSLDEAIQAGLLRVVEQRPATYDFGHAIVRHALLEAMNPDRRARLGRRTALALERLYAGREAEHAPELAWQYHSSAGLPGADRGLAHALIAAEQARASFSFDQAVVFLRIAQDLLGDSAPEQRADILCRLAIAEAEAVLLREASCSTETALVALRELGTGPHAQAEFIEAAARALKVGGASSEAWGPLVDHGIELLGNERDILWARLSLLRDHFEPIVSGPIGGIRWLGADREAVAIARALGDEEDYTRTLDPLQWRTREETRKLLDLARGWRQPMALMRALDVLGRDLIYKHGQFWEAVGVYQELLEVAERSGSIPGQAEAVAQLTALQAVTGQFSLSTETRSRARELIARLGSEHRLRFVETGTASVLAYYRGGDWETLASTAARFASSSEARRSPLGLTAAAFAALGYSLLGDAPSARRLLEPLTPVLECLEPTTYMYNSLVTIAAAAIWELQAIDLAPIYRRLAADLIETGVGPGLFGPHEYSVARMAAVSGDVVEAKECFQRARLTLEQGRLPSARAMVEYDEALTLVRLDAGGSHRALALLDAALVTFQNLEMLTWANRAQTLHEQLAADATARAVTVRATYSGGLTPREAEVLRLVAEGCSNREIATALVLSIPTVERHVANVYAKIGTHGRSHATAYALKHGFATTD